MALIDCPDCGRRVSDAATACPDCARPIAGAPRHVERVTSSEGSAPKPDADAVSATRTEEDLAAKRERYAIGSLARSFQDLSRTLEGKKCPRCGKDLRADYVLVSERTGEFCCLECVEKTSEIRTERRRFMLRLRQLAPTLVLLSILASALAVGAYAIATAPATTTRAKK
jgi:predicted amidophosphoribosyltransferase